MEESFNSWLSRVMVDLGGEVIPIDGKTVRGSYDQYLELFPRAICLEQHCVDRNEMARNEIALKKDKLLEIAQSN